MKDGPGLDVLARRRRVVLIGGLVVVGLLLAAGIIGSVVRSSDSGPPEGSGLLAWEPRGGMLSDHVLIDSAQALWRGATDVTGATVVPPEGEIYVLWADRIGAGRVVIMEAVGIDGKPYVVQASEQGEPAALGLDSVSELPVEQPIVLAVTYDGNLNIDGLEPGRGSALIQLLTEPEETSGSTGLWKYEASFDGSDLELLETKPSGMTETFLQLDASDPAGTSIVVATTVDARAGVAGTLAVQGGRLLPRTARIALADDPSWGPSGRIDGKEYAALVLAAADLPVADATGFVAASEEVDVDGVPMLASLVVLQADDRPGWVACVLSDPGDEDTVADVVVTDPRAVVPAERAVLAGSCPVDIGGDTRVVAVAAGRPGAGPVRLQADGRTLAGPAEFVVVVLDEPAVSGSLVARLDGGEGAGSSFSLPSWVGS